VHFADASVIYFRPLEVIHPDTSALDLADKGLLCSSGMFTFSLLLLKNFIDNPDHQHSFEELATITWLTTPKSFPFGVPDTVREAMQHCASTNNMVSTQLQFGLIGPMCFQLLTG
jgi:hypothetical protein